MNLAIPEAEDRGEAVALMEPMRLSEESRHRRDFADLILDLTARSAGFRRSLPPGVLGALADLVRAMNCYYSNLIEGHDTHPVQIERALRNDYSADPAKRDLQMEARAHITVQAWIDAGGLAGAATSVATIRDIHERFCRLLPEEMLWSKGLDGRRIALVPGAFRQQDVEVGNHVAVSPGSVSRFLNRFEQAYDRMGRAETILAAAAAHHRLLWIHPFLDGNGRVARLMSHAMLREALETGGVWSIARGLARRVAEYKGHLGMCDLPRRNDHDGRGARSEEALAAFTRFFLEVCLDQVDFMEKLVEPNRLRARILHWAEDEARVTGLSGKAGQILEAVLFRGELPREDVPGLIGSQRRQATRIVGELVARGVLTGTTIRSPLRLVFPARLASRWMPGLFPDAPA